MNGNETITGSKTFNATTIISGSNNLALMYLDGKKALASTGSTHTAQIIIRDVNNKSAGVIQNIRYAAGYTATDIGSYNSDGTSVSLLRLCKYDNGTTYATCPTPTDTTSTSSTQIATVGWCNNRKQETITGAATTITSSNLTASRALVSNSSGKVDVSSVTSTELGYVSGVTSAIQTQLSNKQDTLVSGTNIKTVNSTSLLGSGNLTISGGGITPTWSSETDVKASCYTSSGTGYKPTKNGFLYFTSYQLATTSTLYVYSGSTLVSQITLAGSATAAVGYTMSSFIPASKNYSYRIYGGSSGQSVIFIPCE